MNVGLSPAHEPGIADLPALIASLPVEEQTLVDRLFEVVADVGVMVPPPEMVPWLEQTLGSVAAVREQSVVRVMNRWTCEGASFNPLRARRPGAGAAEADAERLAAVRRRIEETRGDDFCDPAHHTPEESFGRVFGRHCRTAANLARADGWHGVVIFDEHDPLAVDGDALADALEVVRTWAGRVREADARAGHLFVLWNCLWRAGASLVHGHLQMTLGRAMAHARVELWRAAARRYAEATGREYFGDLVAAHRALGLCVTRGEITALASLTPAKEREVVLLAPPSVWKTAGAGDVAATAPPLDGLARALGSVVTMYRELGVLALNAAIFGPPLDGAGGWEGFPLVARLVDRGDPLSSTADVAALELYGSSVIAHDPFAVARRLAEAG